MKPKHKVILVIRDGWGYRKEKEHNAIAETPTPNTDKLMAKYPNTLLNASGEAVGVPHGYQGNSEVGHMTIGGGRIIFQSLARINKAIEEGSFFKIPEFLEAIENCKKHNTTLHLVGLLQVEGVHAHINHLLALLDLCKKQNFTNVVVHVITDGRDAPVTASLKHLNTLNKKIAEIGFGKIATVSGRYYAMDRDKRWQRTKKAYECIVNAQTERVFDEAKAYLEECHAKGETDEFITPGKAEWYGGIKPDDSFIFYNFRTDRPRQLTQAMTEIEFTGWETKPLDIFFVTMTQYFTPQVPKVAFKDQVLTNFLGEVVAKQGMHQLRISETEKYAHVTFFFNGQIEEPYENEDRILIPSPKVETYDKKPEMSVYEITEVLTKAIDEEKYDLIVTNLVNGDMVGHTGDIEAIHKAIAAVDECVGKITEKGLAKNYTILVFADHGNAEDQTEEWRTSHTTNPVPLIFVSNDTVYKSIHLKKGKGLQDVAPTVLELMGIEKPQEMTGESLIEK
ncbi:MAG: 2,3-bisphosphoglycerate-independent phosphoglycerate mutase [Patescibacteria group bacterium]|jgi:2,3-bisphosphoglycerate-independent phosphoglycerate mutase